MVPDQSASATPAGLTIVLVRAGRTDYDCQGRIQGTLDVPLSDDGRQQVESAAAELALRAPAVDALYVGPCLSAQETATIVGVRLQLKPKTIEQMHNINQGLWQGMLFDDVKTKHPRVYRQWQDQPESVCPPEGEAVQEVRERLTKVLAKLSKKHKHGTIAAVVAGPLACVLRGMLRREQITGLCMPACHGQSLWESIPVETLAKT